MTDLARTTDLEQLAKKVGSRRYARDLLEEADGGAKAYAKPWWDMPGEESRELKQARVFDRFGYRFGAQEDK